MHHLSHLLVAIILCQASGLRLKCTHDYDTSMSCHIDARNCTELKMTLHHSEKLKKRCFFGPCTTGCCCTMDMTDDDDVSLLIIGNPFIAKVSEGGQSVHSQTVDILQTIKPPRPTIILVDKLNKIYQMKWRTNARRSIREDLLANVTYGKKNDTSKKIVTVKPSTVEDMNYFEILDQDLVPSTTYVVSVKTYTQFNVSSDRSDQYQFTTDSSRNGVFIATIVSLCVVAVVLSGVSFALFIRFKGKMWDRAVKVEMPKPLNIKPKKEEILSPEYPLVYSLSAEPLLPKDSLMLSKESLFESSGRSGQSLGMSSGESSLHYANTAPVDSEACVLGALQMAFPIFSPSMDPPGSEQSKLNCVTPPDEMKIAPVTFDNKSYIGTQSPKSIEDIDRQVTGDSGYHCSDTPPPQDFILVPQHLTLETDMSYQPCGQSQISNGLSLVSDSSLPVGYGYQDFDKVELSNNVPSEYKTQCQFLLTGFPDNFNTSEMGALQAAIPHVSHEITVDSGYHCV